jgi:Nif-specific regulatory protein
MASRPDREDERLRLERDLYMRLLELGTQNEVEPFLEEAVTLVVGLVSAKQGYLELRDPAPDAEDALWSISHGFSEDEVASVRAQVSSGIIAEALSSGRIVHTPSALLDPRFQERESVRDRRIEEVLCAPVGQDPPRGVLYLQRGGGAGGFSEDDRNHAASFCRHLAPMVDHLLLRRRMAAQADPTRSHRARLRADGVVGRSPALASLLSQVALVSPIDVSVLLSGQSGTGKSQIARVIHESGPRAARPFVELNCASIPEGLAESELFGALPGSHSTATQRVGGKVEAAERGTLFLDEVGELGAQVQAKLLQLLQSKTYYPLGANEPRRADVRIIAASNADLEARVEEGRFRADLLYRLQVLPLRVPSLAERREDVPDLSQHFAALAAERHHLPRLPLSPTAVRAVEAAEWPGNIRQLENAIEAALIRAAGEGSSLVERHHVFPDAPTAAGDPGDPSLSFQEATRRFQRELIERALDETGWNVTAAAKNLQMARSRLYEMIKAFGIARA